jgi:prepilin-type N-terminal cleavage/methylation domain-containing protein
MINRKIIGCKSSKSSGFSLVEVIIALAVFGILVGGILSFLPWGVDGVSKIKDRSTAMSLIDATLIELERIGFPIVEAGTDRLVGKYEFSGTPIDGQTINQVILVAKKTGGGAFFEQVTQSEQSVSEDGSVKINKDRDATLLTNYTTENDEGFINFDMSNDYPISLRGLSEIAFSNQEDQAMNRWVDEKERFFRIVCSQYPASSRHAHHISNGYLALEIEVQWPYKIFDPSNAYPNDFRETEEKFRSKFTFPLAISR